MQAWWQMWPGYFTANWCQQVVSDALALPIAKTTIGQGDTERADESYRTSQLRWVKFNGPLWDVVANDMERLFRIANNNVFGFDLNLLRDIQFTEYRAENAGHYDWHEDIFWRGDKSCHRKLSIVVQLSDQEEYEGGELELKHEAPEADVLRKQGTVIVFPSFCPHQVTAVTKGIRHSLVGWYEGPEFK